MSEKALKTNVGEQIAFLGSRVIRLANDISRLKKLTNDRDEKVNRVIERLKKAIPHVNFED